MTYPLGIDVSDIQGAINATKVFQAGIAFISQEFSIGNEPARDSRFAAQNTREALAAGLMVQPYHFAFPLPHIDPAADCDRFLSLVASAWTAGVGPGWLPACLDFEWPYPDAWVKWGCTPAQLADWALAWCRRYLERTGRKAYLYTFGWFWNALGDERNRPEWADVVGEWWLADPARYGTAHHPEDGAHPNDFEGIGRARFWQFNQGKGKPTNGVNGPVDRDAFLGTLDDLRALANVPATQDGDGGGEAL